MRMISGAFCIVILWVQVSSTQEGAGNPAPLPDAAEVQQEIQQVETIIPKLPDRGAGLFLLAHDYAQLGKTDKALALLGECLALDEGFDPEHDPAFRTLKPSQEFQKLVERVHRRYPIVHHARAAFLVPEKDLVPEGLVSDPQAGVLYMSSLHLRKIVKITRSGAVSDFIRAGQYHLGPICGLKVDPGDHSLWANTCPDNGQGAELLHFDGSGRLAGRYPPLTSGKHLFNDLVLQAQSGIYLTDSLANRVYRWNRKSNAFAEMPLCRDVYYPNGIALSDDDRWLYVADAFGILQIDLPTGTCHEVDAGKANTVSGADGLYWYRNSLVAVQNSLGESRIARFRLSRDGSRVSETTILEYRTPFVVLPTTGAIEGSQFYFMSNTQIDNLKEDKIMDPAKLEPVRISVVDLGD